MEGAGERPIEVWRLRRGENGAKLRVRLLHSGLVKYYEGEKGAERKVRSVFANGAVAHFEGERGAERKVRKEFPSGQVQYYEGDRGAERVVRMVRSEAR